MALRPMGLSNAASNFVNSYMMGKQVQAERAEADKQNQIRSMMGGMLMGQSSPEQQQEFSQLAPQQFVNTQNYLSQQQASQAAAANKLTDERDKNDLMKMLSTDEAGQNAVIDQRIAEITQAGGDASDSEYLRSLPIDQRNKWLNMQASQLGITAPKPPAGDEFAQGTGDMSGYVFNKTQGNFSLDPEVKAVLDAKASEKANTELDIDDKRSINNDVTSLSKEPTKIRNAASRLEKISKSKSATDQLAAVFTFMKALDPSSVVREGEQDMARKTGGLTDTLLVYVESLKSGDSLPPEVFDDMVRTAQRISNQAVTDAGTEVSGYLNAYGDSLSDKQKSLYQNRLPALFEISEKELISDEDLLAKYNGTQ